MKSRLPWIVWLLILLLGFTGPVQALNAVVPDLSKIGQTKCTAKIEHGSFPINFTDTSGMDDINLADNVTASLFATGINSQGLKFQKQIATITYSLTYSSGVVNLNWNVQFTVSGASINILSLTGSLRVYQANCGSDPTAGNPTTYDISEAGPQKILSVAAPLKPAVVAEVKFSATYNGEINGAIYNSKIQGPASYSQTYPFTQPSGNPTQGF